MHGLYFMRPCLIYYKVIVLPFNFMLVMADFSLIPQLRQLVDVLVSAPNCKVGDGLPISIWRRFSYSQTIVIFPEDGYNFFMPTEINCILAFVEIYKCSAIITAIGDIPVVKITAYLL